MSEEKKERKKRRSEKEIYEEGKNAGKREILILISGYANMLAKQGIADTLDNPNRKEG